MKIPLFDLDGTLLVGGSGNKPHRDGYDFAIQSIYQLHASVNEITTDGMIDNQILATVASLHNVPDKIITEKLPSAIQAEVEYYIAHKDNQPSIAHSGAKELLEKLRRDTHCGVLTGNAEPIAYAKLEQAGLRDYISFGAFGDMALKRVDLITIAQKQYEEQFGEKRPVTDFVIIGDTPKDIQCAREGGISVIAVATGNYTKEDLEKEKPDLAIDSLVNKEEIFTFLQTA